MEKELKQWLSLGVHGYTLKSFFISNQIKNIAIYGGADLGDYLYTDVKKYGVNVKFCIDDVKERFHDIMVVRPSGLCNINESVDLVVICGWSLEFEAIRGMYNIVNKAGFNCIALDEVLRICYYKEVLIPYCDSLGVVPYILAWPFHFQLTDLSPLEKVVASVRLNAELFKTNLGYFSDMYSDVSEYSDQYIWEVFTQSPTIRKDNTIIHSDVTSRFVNIINGIRFTVDTPEFFDKTVRIIGHCLALGFGVDDSRTISSYLQRALNNADDCPKTRVVNHGVWGFDINSAMECVNKLSTLPCSKGDIVVFFNDLFLSFNPFVFKCFSNTLNTNRNVYFSLFDEFCKPRDKGPLYFDHAHLTHRGMQRVAEFIFNLLKNDKTFYEKEMQRQPAKDIAALEPKPQIAVENDEVLGRYISYLKSFKKFGRLSNGAIVMNCNPFTKGHRYLIEIASKKVDILYIFVVEEDRSTFPFEDRLNLVKLGTGDLKNVIVLPSGKFILSAVTFPEYFIKDSFEEVVVDTSKDIEIFAHKIAPVLNIKKRFVGKEPFDPITRQYNQTMKDILPKHRIEVIELERHTLNKVPISASRVRKLIEVKDWNEISKLVPEATLQYLQSKVSGKSGHP